MIKGYYFVAMILGCMALPNPVNAQSFFSAKLSASQETHDVVTDGRGTAALALTDAGLRFLVSVDGLSGPIAAAHFHNGPAGEDGDVVRAITDDFTGNTASGIWTATDGQPLTDELIQSLLAGNLYLNVHTAANGAGEIRGHVQISAGTQLGASLTAAQETHDVVSNATGSASVVLTDAGAAFNITVDGLSGPIAAAHFHNGPAGEDGSIVRTLTDDFTGNTASGLWTASDGQPLTAELIQSLLAGDLYINVHTAANGAGEIRGQVRTSSGWGFSAMLNADQETHSVVSDATGSASVTLTDAGVVFNVTVEGLSGPIAAAHFHNGPAGQDGDVVRSLTDDFVGNTASGLWSSSDDQPLTDEHMMSFLSGDIYFNVHTAANGAGEIRGQVVGRVGMYLKASLTAAQETHDVVSGATGTASVVLTDAGAAFEITVEGLSGPIAAAHFHNGPAGEDGDIVRTLTDDFTGNTASGTWTSSDGQPLTDDLIQSLLAGDLYINVHTAANGAGEIRGQVQSSAGTSLRTSLTAAQETHDVVSNALGAANVVLTDAGVAFNITVEGLSGPIAAAHFHNGPAGKDGDVVRTLTDDFVGNTASGLWTASDSQPLTDELIQSLLAGNLYLNVHTATNGAGEIRGQVHLSSGIGTVVQLDSDQETHDVTSDASGTASLTLTDAGVPFDITVEGLSGPIVAAHFHNGIQGLDGPVRRPITDDFTGNTASGFWTASDTDPLTDELLLALLAGEMYLNVHTAANGAGEIRGQVRPNGIVVTTVEQIDREIPRAFTLSQNYPNPFNPVTNITFSLTRPTYAVLTIYNTLGQKIATLVDGSFSAGSYQIRFDTRSLASGVYLYQLEADGQRSVKQMILLK